MEYANFRISLNVNNASSGAALTVKHGDNKRRIYIYLTEDEHPYPLRGNFIAVLRAKKSDGTILYNYCTIEKDAVVYDMTAQTTAATGRVDCELLLYSAEGEQLTSSRFIILVDSALYPDETVTSMNEATELQRLLADSKVLKDIVQNNWDSKVDKVSGKGLSSNDFTAELKSKLSGIEAGANKYIHPAYTAKSAGMYKVTVDGNGHVSAASPITKEDIVGLGISAEGKTYTEATTRASGLMSASDKEKLDRYPNNGYYEPVQTVKVYNPGTDGEPTQTGEDIYFDETEGYLNFYAGEGVTLSEYTDPSNVRRRGIKIKAAAIPGEKGDKGEQGKSAYEVYVENGGTLSAPQWLASLAQTGPEFADDVSGCTDTSKVYVLPDGYIYAYMTVTETVKNYTNLADPLSSDWTANARVNSSGGTTEAAGATTTNYVSCTAGDLIRVKGLDLRNYNTAVYNSAKSVISASKLPSYPSGYLSDITAGETLSVFLVASADVKFVRFSGVLNGSSEDVVITKNQIISESTVTEQKWQNTGLAFVPADYEDRILTAENSIGSMKVKLEALETGAGGELLPPDYWITAIEAGADSIKERQASGADAFQFVWFSDMHGVNGYPNTNGAGKSSQTNIGKVAGYLCNQFNIPFVATSGDIMSQESHAAVQDVYDEYKGCNKILSYIDTDKFIATVGNHDGAWGAPVNGVYYLKDIGNRALYNEIYRKQATDLKRVFGNDGTYFYVDSVPGKVRFIMLNSNTDGDGSADASGNAVYNSMKNSVYGTEQLAWLGDCALHMPAGWTAVIMAHQPISTSKDGALLAGILEAYNARQTYSGTVTIQHDYWGNGVSDNTYKTVTADVDFTEAAGEIAAFFHGHIHKDTIDTTTYSFPSISITTAGGDVRDESPAQRTPGTATETALDVVTLDKAARKIYLTRFGVGNDRVCDY